MTDKEIIETLCTEPFMSTLVATQVAKTLDSEIRKEIVAKEDK